VLNAYGLFFRAPDSNPGDFSASLLPFAALATVHLPRGVAVNQRSRSSESASVASASDGGQKARTISSMCDPPGSKELML
jgi:hypothetical protein